MRTSCSRDHSSSQLSIDMRMTSLCSHSASRLIFTSSPSECSPTAGNKPSPGIEHRTVPIWEQNNRPSLGIEHRIVPIWEQNNRSSPGIEHRTVPIWEQNNRSSLGIEHRTVPIWEQNNRSSLGIEHRTVPIWEQNNKPSEAIEQRSVQIWERRWMRLLSKLEFHGSVHKNLFYVPFIKRSSRFDDQKIWWHAAFMTIIFSLFSSKKLSWKPERFYCLVRNSTTWVLKQAIPILRPIFRVSLSNIHQWGRVHPIQVLSQERW